MAREKSFADLARERSALKEETVRLYEGLHAARSEAEHKQAADSARIQELESRLAESERGRRALVDEAGAAARDASALRAQLAERDRLREIERARVLEESRLVASAEASKSYAETEAQRARAFSERAVELEKSFALRLAAFEAALVERARTLDARERRLEELSVRLQEERAGRPDAPAA